ncbi:RibD family protein [Mediterraneibacter glycyrrhizinilyticus]|uniref:RibD family protein n=1 Tax=Mediterraneibacter glycyrrhizinilyticus TaxID=342942 RepID=UPI0025AA7445|nr:RibD family protein [Mediterraneibacter glycyrrhizinilyticus]MDN0060278.1 RibD family protein [Mediterraneibacter glycyrrhizinilyticus]
MKRPYVICHILSSLDGKINGPFMGTQSAGSLAREYGRIRTEMDADAWMYGTSTAKEFTAHSTPVLKSDSPSVEGDFAAVDHAELYYVSIDTKGEIGWESGTFNIRGRDSHVIEILTESTPDAYKAYLREKGVSYVIAGSKELDCRIAMEKLYSLFHIKKLLLCGGGIADWSFLRAGMVDELSLLLAPVTDGGKGSASLFTQKTGITEGAPVEFTLQKTETIGDSGLYLNYLAKNAVLAV